nr:hypothetical protein [Tanacetum cinerariifolium]
MGDDHFASVHGKESVMLEFSSRKSITFCNVLYVPKVRKNLISGLVLNKYGYKQVYESFLDDSGLEYMSSSTVVNTSLWHARSGHVHYKRMLEMPKDDLILAIDENTRKFNTCMLIKINRQPFKSITRKSIILELIHSDVCDFHATPSLGIIHETTAPYTPQQNSVAERKNKALKEMVNSMLSYSGSSEGFWGEAMFYVIEPNDSVSINTIIESRDAIFDEKHFSSIPRPKDIIPNLNESQRDDHSNDVPSETLKSHRAIYNLVIHQMDVKIEFLNGDLEEAYMKQPEGFFMQGNEHKLCKLVKSLKFDGSGKGVIICLHVDDMLIFGTDQNQVDKTKKFLSSKFSMKDMGESDVIPGKPLDQLEYSRAIGCFIQHWHAITRVFKCLKGTMNYGLSYVRYPSVLEACSDASWINHVEDSSSTSRWMFLLGGGAISWASKKQTCITDSTMEYEFVALSNVAVMSSASSTVSYTSVYTDSEPGRVFWGTDKELSDGGSPRAVYDGIPMQSVALPSPDYILPHDPDYVPEPMYPEYIPLEDEHVLLAEEQPLPPVDSPTAESPGYVVESDPEEDPEEYEDDESEDGLVNYPMDEGDDGDNDDGDSFGDDVDDEDEDEEDEEEEE